MKGAARMMKLVDWLDFSWILFFMNPLVDDQMIRFGWIGFS